MTSAPVLRLPYFNRIFCVETNASDFDIGVVLFQDGYPLAFFSEKLGPGHRNAYTYHKELYAIVEAVQKWRPLNIPLSVVQRVSSSHCMCLRKYGETFAWISLLDFHLLAVIMVTVDRLSKYAHFAPLPARFYAISVSRLFIDTVVKHHGFPKTLVSDRDPIILSST
ncbi:uncharacterized protein LOC121770483 [Salvia splendens]|uniref:uncharacterized protein LOC121770483 n=1 Tax=Salvia splendens TaxID=180675 RepID=UPI001C264F7C|nr:uncharacterized protein LOC121770483 [Salvia splendens]